MEGEAIANGAVAVEGARIAAVAGWKEISATHSGEVIDLGEMVLMPGLINAHCHLDYTMLRGKIGAQASFADWIRAINAQKAPLTESDYIASIIAGWEEARRYGTTSLLNMEAFPELLPRLPRPPLRVWWCAEMIDLRRRVNVSEIAEALRAWFGSHPEWLGGFGLAPHAPYTASAELYAEAGRVPGVPLATHLAESREEMQLFRDATGPLFDFLKTLGRLAGDCGRATPLSHLLDGRLLDGRWIIAHLNELIDADFKLLEEGPKFHVVHCPRSHTFFGHAPFAWKKLRSLGFNIAVGTDSLASNSSLSLFAELRQLSQMEMWMAPREILETVTVNAAAGLSQANSLGKIRAGFYADLIGIPSTLSEKDSYAGVIKYDKSVPWMMINGEVLGTS